VITKFKLFENDEPFRRTYSYEDLAEKDDEIYNNLKFKVGEPVRLKGIETNLIFYIDWINVNSDENGVWYHIKDDKYIYQRQYRDFELEKLSEEEKMQLKYNL